jgi:hypothetical protein
MAAPKSKVKNPADTGSILLRIVGISKKILRLSWLMIVLPEDN